MENKIYHNMGDSDNKHPKIPPEEALRHSQRIDREFNRVMAEAAERQAAAAARRVVEPPLGDAATNTETNIDPVEQAKEEIA